MVDLREDQYMDHAEFARAMGWTPESVRSMPFCTQVAPRKWMVSGKALKAFCSPQGDAADPDRWSEPSQLGPEAPRPAAAARLSILEPEVKLPRGSIRKEKAGKGVGHAGK